MRSCDAKAGLLLLFVCLCARAAASPTPCFLPESLLSHVSYRTQHRHALTHSLHPSISLLAQTQPYTHASCSCSVEQHPNTYTHGFRVRHVPQSPLNSHICISVTYLATTACITRHGRAEEFFSFFYYLFNPQCTAPAL